MRKCLELVMNAVLLSVFLTPDASPQAAEEFKRLTGTWELIEEEQDGKVVGPDQAICPPKVRFTDKKPKGIEDRCDIYTIALDPKADPPRITATVAGGEIKGQRMLVIYRLHSDRLTLRLAYGAKNFPTGFRTAKDDGTFVLILSRVKE
jgi:uncharacterized protein (TIGR03067 family)